MKKLLVSTDGIATAIVLARGQRVMLDADLANLYGVSTKALNQAVKRNLDRFPDDFMFQLSWEEAGRLRSGPAASGELRDRKPRSQSVTLKRGANVKYRPRVFTEQGVAMLSSVLRSSRAIAVNIEIMRAFVRLRQMLASNVELSKRLNDLERKYDSQFKVVFDAIRALMEKPDSPRLDPGRVRIGFVRKKNLSRRANA